MSDEWHSELMKQLKVMSDEDLETAVWSDPLVKSVMSAVPEGDRQGIHEFVSSFIEGWRSGTVDPIVEMAQNPEFVAAFMRAMASDEPGGMNGAF